MTERKKSNLIALALFAAGSTMAAHGFNAGVVGGATLVTIIEIGNEIVKAIREAKK